MQGLCVHIFLYIQRDAGSLLQGVFILAHAGESGAGSICCSEGLREHGLGSEGSSPGTSQMLPI